jgi:hypothetical protein
VVLRYLRKAAHAALGDPDGINADDDPSLLLPTADEVDDLEDLADAPGDDLEPEDFEEDVDTLGLFEWSAPPGCSVMDRDGWAQSNPSMGHGIAERTIAGDAKGDPEWVFRTEVLCQWSDGSLEGPFPPGTWDGCQDPASKIAPGSAIIAAVDVSWDRTHAHIAIAGLRDDGLPHVGVVASRAGVDWVIPWLTGQLGGVDVPPFESVVVQERGAAASDLIDPLESAGLTVTRWGGSNLPGGTGAFYEAVRSGNLRHRGQPVLDVAAATAVPKLTDGGSFIWDRRKSPVDIAPLVAVTGALWGVMNRPKPTRSIYEDRGLELV